MMISLSEFLKIPKEKLYGKIFVFPTDTVYGIGTFWDDFQAIEKIYEIKEREKGKPLAILTTGFDQIKNEIEIIHPRTLAIIEEYWPGALTIIFKKKPSFSYPLDTLGFRVPNSQIALAILNYLGPLATTSVNYSGEIPINDVSEIDKLFGNKIDYIITDQTVFSKTSSTVIDLTTENLKVLRQGTVLVE